MDIKELKKLIKYLRSEGVTEYKCGDLQFKLGTDPKPRKPKQNVSAQVNDVPYDGPSQDELLFWSAGNAPDTTKDNA